MQKYNIPCINTSAFAKLCNTNKRTLIHYDEIGLFKPAYTDERGYRYYSESQCDVFFTITCLKDLGMPLKEIKTYVDNRNPEDLTALLLEQQKKVQQELLHLMRIEKVIQTKLELVTEGAKIAFSDGCSAPFLQEFPDETLIATPYLGTSNHDAIISALCEHIGYVNHEHLNTGHPYGAIMSVADIKAGYTDRYAYFITKVAGGGTRVGIGAGVGSGAAIGAGSGSAVGAGSDSGFCSAAGSDFVSDASVAAGSDTDIASGMLPNQQILTKPAGRYAVIYLQGDYYLADDAFRLLLDFIEERGLCAGEYCYKEAVWDELTVENEAKYITRISIPV